jgi:hypothetical protein
MDDRREFFGAVGERLKARVFWIVMIALASAGLGLAGVLFACTLRNGDKAAEAYREARNNESAIARVEEQCRANGRGIEDIQETLREMHD